MGYRTRQLLRGLSGISLLVSVGSIIAAVNWHSNWRSIAMAGAQESPPITGLVAVEAQATFQQWVIVALIGFILPLACCVFPDAPAGQEPLGRSSGRDGAVLAQQLGDSEGN